jgi:hypothetical protein
MESVMKKRSTMIHVAGFCAALALPVAAVANEEIKAPSEGSQYSAPVFAGEGAGDAKEGAERKEQ